MAYLSTDTGISPKDWALIPGRLSLGSTMLFHGASKLRGEGPLQTAQMFGQLGLKRARFWALATGIAEVAAGASALLGIGTRVAALAVLVTQGVAIAKVHAKNGFDIGKGGYEFNLALIASALALLAAGPGRASAHELAEHAAKRRRARTVKRWVRLLK